jgi:hypothetical protein
LAAEVINSHQWSSKVIESHQLPTGEPGPRVLLRGDAGRADDAALERRAVGRMALPSWICAPSEIDDFTFWPRRSSIVINGHKKSSKIINCRPVT